MLAHETVQRQVAAQPPPQLHRDAADAEQPLDLPLREAVDGLVAGDAVLVEAPRLGARVEEDNVVPFHGQPMGAGQPRGPGPHDGDALAGGGGALVGMPVARHPGVGGEALQAADRPRLALGRLPHARLLAQRLGGTGPRAHPAQDVAVEDGLRRRPRRSRRDLAHEEGDVDAGRTGRHAGRVVAEVATVRGHGRLVGGVRRPQVGEVLPVGPGRQTAGRDARCDNRIRQHQLLPPAAHQNNGAPRFAAATGA